MTVTLCALIIANSPLKEIYNNIFHHIYIIRDFNLHMIINDFLMAIFFLSIGLEIKKEILYGVLSSFRKASFPIMASIGGVIVPAIIFTAINKNTQYSYGMGVVISTDIAFAIGIFMIFKSKLNPNLKIFLLSLAVVDDLISVLAIGFLYSSNLNYNAIIISLFVVLALFSLNKIFKVQKIYVYLIVGMLLWYFIYISGIHSTISGVILAFSIPYNKVNNKESIAEKLEHKLSIISNRVILPLFAFANTAITFNLSAGIPNFSNLTLGIICGLAIGKPLGVMLFSFIATKLHIAEKDKETSWKDIFSVSLLTGIGFTMSIFVAEIAFANNQNVVNIAKISILTASILSVVSTQLFLNLDHGIISVKRLIRRVTSH